MLRRSRLRPILDYCSNPPAIFSPQALIEGGSCPIRREVLGVMPTSSGNSFAPTNDWQHARRYASACHQPARPTRPGQGITEKVEHSCTVRRYAR